jgi:hypothetical protein
MYIFHWTPELLDHVEQHGVTQDEFELTVNDPDEVVRSRSSRDPLAMRWDGDRWVYCVYRWVVERAEVEPVTAWVIEHE